LITNSHYANIWPIDDLAAGGLLGNIIFFAASGFCLFNVKENFGKWYVKRILRIYPIMILFTLFTVLIGEYPLKSWAQARQLLVFPTNYVFLVWLVLLYAVFYLVVWLAKKYSYAVEISLGCVLGAWLIVYFIFVDKSVYCIDDVSKPFILFLYFSSMLMGGLFKKYIEFYKKGKIVNILLLFVSLIVYFGSKIAFSKIASIVFWQIANQISILFVLYFLFAVFIAMEDIFKKVPKWLHKTIKFIADITLHIYLVQFVIIYALENLPFPINFVLTTLAILAAASALYFAEYYTRKGVSCLFNKLKVRKKNAESKD
jgi:peptidoglycan/LPS O-acetylase OafA/YrhL